MAITITSKQFSINISDFLKGLIVAVISPVFTTLITSLNAGSFNVDWKDIGITASVAFLSYILKNFLTPSQTIIKS